MKLVKVGTEKSNIKKFVDFPKRMYSSKDNMESASQMKALLEGTHPLSKYFDLDAYLILRDDVTAGRFAITTYPDDTTAYLGFFECINDKEVSSFLFSEAEKIAKEKKCSVIIGPVDASFWLKYRLKINNFDLPPYTGEPYNKDYYLELFQNSGYEISEHYTSSAFRSVGEDYINEKFENRNKEFLAQGYKIESPKAEEYEKAVEEVYTLITELYSDFPVYKNVSKEDFCEMFKSYKTIMNMSMTKMAYYNGKFGFDMYFDRNFKAAREAGLKTGVYFYTQDCDETLLREHVKAILEKLDGAPLELPIAYDFESWREFHKFNMNIRDINRLFDVFCEEVEKAGYTGMLYGSREPLEEVWTNYNKKPVWLANYVEKTLYGNDYCMWQVSSAGKVDGIDENTDFDVLYTDHFEGLFN